MLPHSSVDAPAFEPRGNTAVRHCAATLAAGDADLRARLGFIFLAGATAVTTTRT
jgi:hypothetical protein